jgi:tetratricopeptide (TPR) repeat protein
MHLFSVIRMRRLLDHIVLVVSVTLLPATVCGQSLLDDPEFREEAKQGLELLYNMEYEAADSAFSAIARDHPNHPVGPFLKALNTWWTILTDLADTSHDDEFFAAMDEVIDRANRLLRRDEDRLDAMYLKGAALGFRGRLRANRSNWFRAALDGKRAMDYVLDVAEENPAQEDYYFGKGLYDYYVEAAPEMYPIVKPAMIFFQSGDKQRGIEQLERTVENGLFVRTEAAYFLVQIFFLYEKDYAKSRKYITWLRDRHPDNSYFHLLEARVYARWARWSQAEQLFGEVVERYRAGRTGYTAAIAEQAYYFLGRIHMRLDNYSEALTYLKDLSELSKKESRETHYSVYGRLREGMVLDRLGRRPEARRRYREVLAMKDSQDAHEIARNYLEEPYPPRDG